MGAYTDDARDFLTDFNKKTKSDLDEKQYVIKEFGEMYERAYQMLNTFYAEAYKDQSFYLGNQWSLEELSYLTNQRRASYTYNVTKRLINLIEGLQRQHRLSTTYTSITAEADRTADILTDVGQFVMQWGEGYEAISRAFRGACITGISWVSPYLDYRDDPVNGDIKFHVDDWNNTSWDPFFYEKDLSDCTFIARRKYLSKSEVMSLLPDKANEIERLGYMSRDDKFTYMPYARQWGLQKLLNYTEYWRAKWVTKDVLVDMRTGETSEWKGDKKRLPLLKAVDPNLEIIKKPVRTVELGIIVEGELLYYGEDPFGLNDYPFVPFTVIFEPSYDLWNWKLQSLVRQVRDPQTELNKRISKMIDMIDGQLNSGWIAKTGAVTNNSSLFKSGQGQVIFLKPEANIDTDIRRIDPPPLPQTDMMLMDAFDKLIPNILGINPEMLGMPENADIPTAAILAKTRMSAGIISLRGLFDGVSESQRILGKKVLTLIQKNYSPEKVAEISKKQPTEEFYSQAWSKYNIVVEEGILTDTQKQSQFTQLLTLKQMGMPIPDSLIIKNSNLHGKEELNEILDAQAQQQQEAAQQQEQLAMQQQAMVSQSFESKSQSDQALAMERLATIGLKKAEHAERIQRAEEDRTASELNFIKSLKELQGIDLNQLSQKIAMLKSLSEIQQSMQPNLGVPDVNSTTATETMSPRTSSQMMSPQGQ